MVQLERAGGCTKRTAGGGGYGLIGGLILGVIGAFAGAQVLGAVGVTAGGFIGRLATATFGAVLCVVLVRRIKRA